MQRSCIICPLSVAVLLSACAQLPSDQKVKMFAGATTAASNMLQSGIDLNVDLAQRLGEEEAAHEYIANPKSDIALTSIDFSSIKKEALPSKELIQAIADYADALSTAADAGTINDLRTAAGTLASTVGGAVSPFAGPAAPLIGPVASLIGRGVGLAIGNAYTVEIREVIVMTDPAVKHAAAILKKSLTAIAHDNRTKIDELKLAKTGNLGEIRHDPNFSKSLGYGDYHAANTEIRTTIATNIALQQYGQILDKMVAAHESLMAPESDPNAALVDFAATIKDIAALTTALKPATQGQKT
jgi:hypothetical protein